ncbi:OmpA family protein [Spirosoma montaniterrae]|uniref:Flagellar motor protein MotB n=1 Tax=Spirosoma montaniterrae TaxID=1178516 RepID=A0A1P9X3B1_9BACT|nr:OmpA family protein [Spirosoma montaniterrae]AQG82126.1 flagellar motor protein MotB [Spirosoma montaniterrae]
MNRLFFLFLFLLPTPDLYAQVVQYTTERPRVDETNDSNVSIKRVELTEQYTIVYMRYNQPREQSGRGVFRRPNGSLYQEVPGGNIGFQPSTRLYVNQGERSYKLLRAENIPSDIRRKVAPGERVDFVAYFERITPGYTTFDLFECRDYVENESRITCFNFWGVHIINPARKPKDATAKPLPRSQPPVATKPAPRPVPRTTPAPAPETPKPDVTPLPTPAAVAISGVTRDAKTKRPIAATVTYRLISGAEAAGDSPADSTQSGSLTGQYRIPDVSRGVYAITVSAKGYFSQSDTLATNRIDVTRDFDLVPIEAGTKITLKNIYFNVSRFDLKPESYPELDRLVTILQTNSTMQIRLEGHTDTVGDFDANVELSRNRVNEVKRYLVSKGISAGRIDTIGYGPSRPINTNKSLKERPENRRVELVIVKV